MDELYTSVTNSIIRKTKVSYSLNEKLVKDFDLICKSKKYKKSEIVENLLKVFIEQEKSLFSKI